MEIATLLAFGRTNAHQQPHRSSCIFNSFRGFILKISMTSSKPSSNDTSRVPTPNPRFTTQASTAADLLASQTVGLVHLSDFRKRRAEALEQKEREAQGTAASFGRFAPASSSASGNSIPNSNNTIIDG